MARTRLRALGIALLLCAVSCGTGGIERTEILWDTWGVPHIYGRNHEELFNAFGRAQMRSHGNLILELYGRARARAAEYWGERYLDSDKWLRTVGVPDLACILYAEQTPEFRTLLDAFADGMNEYASDNADLIDDDVEVVLPVSGADVLAHVLHVIHFNFVTSRRAVRQTEIPWARPGSNGWAIGPARSAGGSAMLLANPHLPWSGFFRFYEMHLVSRGIDFYGTTFVGFPVPVIGFNDRLGWTHTVNTHDGADLYELAISPGGYLMDGQERPFWTGRGTARVRCEDGSLRDETFEIKRSVHGPVVAEKGKKALALRVVGLDRPGMLEQYWDMARARNLAEFEGCLRRLEVPMFTVIYADRDGRIMHLFGGITPVRPEGNWNWQGIVRGDTSATLWTETHPYEDLPRIVDPPSGWLQNANDPPWTTTLPPAISAGDYPPYMAPHFMDLRAQRSAKMLAADSSITFDEMVRYKHSTRMELADRILGELIPAALARGARAAECAGILRAWDRCADADSRGAVLFEAFYRELADRMGGRDAVFAAAWSEEEPVTTPCGLPDPAAAVEALVAASEDIEELYGAADVSWGEVHRLRADGLDLPAGGGPDDLGIFRVVNFRADRDGILAARSGDSFVCVVEFADPVRAAALIGYGNASQHGSPHRTDQLHLFARKQLRPVWLARDEIEANLESRERF